MKQRNHHFNFTIAIDNTIDKVWQSLIDVEKWHQWDTELISANLDGNFVLGAKGSMKPKTGPLLPFYISEFTPHQSYTINTKMPIGGLVIKRSLSTENGMVLFTDDIQFTGFLKLIFGVILGGTFRKVLPEVMNNFKKMAEEK